MVVNFYITHNRRTPLQAEEALGPISIPRGSRGVKFMERKECHAEGKTIICIPKKKNQKKTSFISAMLY
jgi:hypothetical protein